MSHECCDWDWTGDLELTIFISIVRDSFQRSEHTFMALASVRANGVDHFRVSNVEFHRRGHVEIIELRDFRTVCAAARRAAEFMVTIETQGYCRSGQTHPENGLSGFAIEACENHC